MGFDLTWPNLVEIRDIRDEVRPPRNGCLCSVLRLSPVLGPAPFSQDSKACIVWGRAQAGAEPASALVPVGIKVELVLLNAIFDLAALGVDRLVRLLCADLLRGKLCPPFFPRRQGAIERDADMAGSDCLVPASQISGLLLDGFDEIGHDHGRIVQHRCQFEGAGKEEGIK